MSNSYYTHATYPTPNSPGSSAQLRAELELVTAGFDLLPTLSGNAYKVAAVNSAGTALQATASLQALIITASTLNSTPIGGTTAAAGTFTNLTASGTVNLGSTVAITGGSINNTIIGNTTPNAGYFTTLAASSGFTGNVTGNVSGNVTGNVTGNLTGNVTGNVTATSGTSQFNNVTINGNLDMDAASAATITNLPAPTNSGDAANKGYVDTQDALKLALAGGTMSGAIAMGTSKITGLGDPTNAQDAASKNYVDNTAQGLDAKASCVVATTANITLSGTQTIDSIALLAGDRVLVKDQTTTADNGIYVVAASTWSRSTDANTWDELTSAFTFVEKGTTNADSGWVCTIDAGGTLGTTSVTWVQFSGAGQITAGAGLTKTGNTLNVGTASSSRIVVNTDDIDLAASGVTASTYKSVTVDTYGRVTAGTNPTTLSGYGITDAYTNTATDTLLNAKLSLIGGSMTGAIAMGANKITGLADPTANQDAVTLIYLTTLFGSTSSAAASASAAATSASNASTSASNASSSASAASGSATSALGYLNTFKGQYYGALSSDPTLDPLGAAMNAGDLYWNTTVSQMRVYDGAAWIAAYLPSAGYMDLTTAQTAAGIKTFSSNPILSAGTANGLVYLNGSKAQTSGTVLTFDGTTLALGLAGTSTRFQGDFSNATISTRTSFQTGTTNGSTGIYALPNGSSTAASWQATNAADPTNASKVLIATNGSTDVQLVSGINGTGTYLPLAIFNGGLGRFVFGTSGQFGIGPTASVSYGTAGQALLSGGASAAPTWGTAGITTGKSIAMAMIFGF
jgi:hypothetical protein